MRIIFLFLLSLTISISQPFKREASTLPCSVNTSQLSLPFAGGVNNPNAEFFDGDGDGDFDLFVFESDLSLDYYKNVGTKFSPQFQLSTGELTLPEFQTWFLFVDLNGDSLPDLFTDDFGSDVRWYINTGTISNPIFTLQDSVMIDSSGTPILGGLNSIPAFCDIDNDGDLDFFSANSAVGTINFYRNIGTKHNPIFAFETDFWQGIQILGGDNKNTNSSLKKHGASSLYFGDFDHDGKDDLLYGDLFTFGMYYFHHENDSMVAQTNHFPTNDPINSFGFNAPRCIDIDGDNDLDLFVCGLHPGTSLHSFTFYENTGNQDSFYFVRKTDDYLQAIDIGKYSHPTFCDIDGDGDFDLFVGSTDKGIAYFQNIGTLSHPNFILADTSFAHVGGNYEYDPVFIDIDGDGDKDLFVGNFSGRLVFYKNVGTATSPSYALTASPSSDSIHVSQDLSPAFVDIDNDGDFDLFIGKPNGTIAFYRNQGNALIFLPVLEAQSFQNITAGQFAKPLFYDIDNDGDFDLFIGTSEGGIHYYENIGTQTNPQFIRRTNRFAETDKASEVDPTLCDIDNDGE